MKKLLVLFVTALMSISASAQFTTFEPVIVDRNGNMVDINRGSNSNNYYNPYNYNPYNYNPYNYSTPQRSQQESSQVFSLRGYYVKDRQWKSVLIKAKIIEDKVYVVGIKRSSTGWSNANSRAYSTELMQKEIKDNFDFYVRDYSFGNIYF